jgi:hypothetical protein
MCYLPLRSQFLSTPALRPASPAREATVMSGPASGRPVLNKAATGRHCSSYGSAHVLRRSRVATVAINEFSMGAVWSCSAGIRSSGRAHRPVAVLAPGTFVKRCIAPQRTSGQGLAARSHAWRGMGLPWALGVSSGAPPARPNPSVEPTPNRVAPWPGSGYQVHSPLPGQGATLPVSSHLKR